MTSSVQIQMHRFVKPITNTCRQNLKLIHRTTDKYMCSITTNKTKINESVEPIGKFIPWFYYVLFGGGMSCLLINFTIHTLNNQHIDKQNTKHLNETRSGDKSTNDRIYDKKQNSY